MTNNDSIYNKDCKDNKKELIPLTNSDILPDEFFSIIREHKLIESLHSDIEQIAEMVHDLNYLVEVQQSNLDIIDNNIDNTKVKIETTENIVNDSSQYQTRTNKLKIVGIITLGTIIGTGLGGTGILLGLKPIIATVSGGGLGFLASYISLAKY